jgi:hypothetical protein
MRLADEPNITGGGFEAVRIAIMRNDRAHFCVWAQCCPNQIAEHCRGGDDDEASLSDGWFRVSDVVASDRTTGQEQPEDEPDGEDDETRGS